LADNIKKLLIISTMILFGCSLNPFSRHFHKTTIKSNPSGAKVFINEKLIGKTPVVFYEKDEEESYLFKIEKEGYKSHIETIMTALEKTNKKNWGVLWRFPLTNFPSSLPDELVFKLIPESESVK